MEGSAAPFLSLSQISLTTTSSWVPFRPGSPSSTFQPRSRSRSANAAGGRGLPPSSSTLAHQPALGGLVEVADHLPLAVGLVQHPDRGHPPAPGRPAAARTRRTSSTGGRPAARCRRASSTAGPSASRHTPATGPRPGRVVSPESRYAGIRSAGRTRPNSDETATSRVARAALGRRREGRRAEGVVQDPGVDPVRSRGRRGAEAAVEVDQVELGAADAEHLGRRGPRRPRTAPSSASSTRSRASVSGRGSSGRRGRAACHGARRSCPRWAAAGSAPGDRRRPARFSPWLG